MHDFHLVALRSFSDNRDGDHLVCDGRDFIHGG